MDLASWAAPFASFATLEFETSSAVFFLPACQLRQQTKRTHAESAALFVASRATSAALSRGRSALAISDALSDVAWMRFSAVCRTEAARPRA